MFDSFFICDCKACVYSLSGFSSAEMCVCTYVSVCMLGRKGCGLYSVLIIVVFNHCSCCKLK